jgi:hypothetical protein
MRTLRRRWQDEDEGFALASVISMMLLGAIIVTIMLTATMRTIGSTTATRASVQAKAAAQTGIDDVRAMLEAGTCASGTVTGSNPGYTAVLHVSTGTEATASDPVGCPSSSAHSVLVVSTGKASARGVGDAAGDARTVEALLTKPGRSPKFNKAAFGRFGVSLATNLKLLDTSASDSADIFTEGNFTCSSNMVVEGDVYAKGWATFSSAPCKVKGDVLVEGDFTCAAGTTIGGNLYVGGNATFTSTECDIKGIVHVGGNLSMSTGGTKMGTSVSVRGNMSTSGLPATSVETLAIGGTLNGSTGWWWSETKAAYGTRMAEHASVPAPPTYPVDPANEFPQVTADDPAITTGFTPKSWKTTVAAGISGLGWSPDPCGLSAGGSAFPTPIKITTNTRFDTRSECAASGGITVGMGLWFELHADLVIVADKFTQNGNVKFTSGDGAKHSVYIVNPWPTGATTCSTTSGDGIKFESGTWTQDATTAVLLYSAKTVSISTTPTFYGQLYGCSLNVSTSSTLNYVPVGSVSDPSANPWTLSYVRDAG